MALFRLKLSAGADEDPRGDTLAVEDPSSGFLRPKMFMRQRRYNSTAPLKLYGDETRVHRYYPGDGAR